MNKTAWIWQFNGIGGNAFALARDQGFTRIAVKAMDGPNWMGEFDMSVWAIDGTDAALRVLQAANRSGLGCDFWVNPTPTNLQMQVDFWQMLLGLLPGRLILDLEPYGGFWGPGNLQPLADSLVTFQTDSRLGVCFDPRRLDWIDPVLPFASWYMPMTYAANWVNDSLRALERPGVPWECVVSTEMPVEGWQSVCGDAILGNEAGSSGFGVWRLPLLSDEQVAFVKGR